MRRPVAEGDLRLLRRGWPAEEPLALRDGRRVEDGVREQLLRRVVEDVEDLAHLGLKPGRRDQHQAIDDVRTHGGHLRRGPPADGVPEEVHAIEPHYVEEPEVEAREVVDALHPVGRVGAAEARMGGGVDRVALGHRVHPAEPAPVAARPVEDQQGIALAADPQLHPGRADRDRLLARLHRGSIASSGRGGQYAMGDGGGARTLSGTGDQFIERIDHVNDMQGHLLAIAHEVKDLRDRVAGIDHLQAELARLRAERDELQDVLARIGALADRVRPGVG